MNDIRYAIRQLFKNPGFSIIAIVTLALGIGANTAIFSVVNAVLLRPLPYAHPEQLVQVFGTQSQLAEAPCSPANFLDWKERNEAFAGIAAYTNEGYNLTGSNTPERLRGTRVSADFFSLLGVQPILGRAFTAEDDQEGRDEVVILSHQVWQRRFGSDPSIIGRSLLLNNKNRTVLGVMPARFSFGDSRIDLWTPIAFSAEEKTTRDTNYIYVVARLKPGVTFDKAQAHMSMLARQQAEQHPKTNTSVGVGLKTLADQLVGDVRPMLWVLLGAVAFVLLISCGNVANLLLARATDRQKEIAIRSALGASRSRVIRLLLTESVLLALIGGSLGLLLAVWGIDLLVSLKPTNLPRLEEIGIDAPIFGFTLALSLLTGTAFGLVPALQISKTDLNETLKESSRSASGGRARHRVRSLLVISEVALSLVLLIGAGLMIRSFARLLAVDPGFKPDHVIIANIALPTSKYSKTEQQTDFFEQLMDRVRALPGVQYAAVVNDLPLYGSNSTGFDVEGRPPYLPGHRPLIDFRSASPDYFRAMGIPLLKGRAFTPSDTAHSPPVVIVNETMVRKFFGNEDPLGKRIGLSAPKDWREIVGVIGDIRTHGLDAEVRPESFVPIFQNAPGYLTGTISSMSLVARTASDPSALAATIRGQVQALDKDQPVTSVTTLEEYVAESVAQRRFNMLLLGVFAALALILATGGIYGVIAYSVSQRAHEMGIRIALGAHARDIFKLVISQAMLLTIIGIGIGLLGAFALTRLMTSLLYQVSPTDPFIFAALTLLLAFIGLAASYLPARRATKVNPIVALRYE